MPVFLLPLTLLLIQEEDPEQGGDGQTEGQGALDRRGDQLQLLLLLLAVFFVPNDTLNYSAVRCTMYGLCAIFLTTLFYPLTFV